MRIAVLGVLCAAASLGGIACGSSNETGSAASDHANAAEVARATALMEEEGRVLATGDRARRASEKAVHKAQECLDYGDVTCSEAEVAKTDVLTEETEEATTDLRRIHRELNQLSRDAIKAGMQATRGY